MKNYRSPTRSCVRGMLRSIMKHYHCDIETAKTILHDQINPNYL